MSVVVVGSGVAGTLAALSARAQGAPVVVISGPPAASAMWSGIAEIFGPAYDSVDYQTRVGIPHLEVAGRPPLESPSQRFDRLLRRRSFHPYARLGLGAKELKQRVGEAAALIEGHIELAHQPSYVASSTGQIRLADGGAASIWAGRLGDASEFVVCGFEHYPRFNPEACVQQLRSQGLEASSFWLRLENNKLAQNTATASSVLERLEDDELTALGRQLAVRVAGGVTLLPPILGRTTESHGHLVTRLNNEGANVAELGGVQGSLHGFRLRDKLQSLLKQAGCWVHEQKAESARWDKRRIVEITMADGASVDVSALVLATGRALGGGITRVEPVAESLIGLPLFLDGAALEPDAVYAGNLATERWLDDHPVFRMGVGVDQNLRPLNMTGKPAFENLHAAGLIVGGTDFTRDGSALGVSLVTGMLAGREAARSA